MKDLKKKSSKALAWDLSGKFINQGVTFVISIFLARLLSPEDFGLLAMATVFIGLTSIFMDFGLSSALVQKKNTTDEQLSTVFYLNFAIGSVLMIIMYFCSGLVADYYNNTEIINIVKVLSLLFVISAINLVQMAQLIKSLNFKILTKANIISAAISGVIGIGMAFAGFGVWSLVAKTMIAGIIQVIVIWSYSSWRPQKYFNLRNIKGHWTYGYKLFLSGLINNIYSKVDVLVIGKLFTAADLGYYYRAKSFNQLIVKYSSDSLSRIFFPVFSEIQDDLERVRNIISKSLNILSFLIFGIMGVLYLCAEDLLVLLFGEKWIPAIAFFKILVFFAYAYPISSVLVTVISGLGNSAAFLKLEIIKKILLTIAIPIGFLFGIEGYLYAMIIVGFVGVSLNMWFVQKQIDYSIFKQYKDVFIYAIPFCFLTIAVHFLTHNIQYIRFLHLLCASISFLITYLVMNILMKTRGIKIFQELLIKLLEKRKSLLNYIFVK